MILRVERYCKLYETLVSNREDFIEIESASSVKLIYKNRTYKAKTTFGEMKGVHLITQFQRSIEKQRFEVEEDPLEPQSVFVNRRAKPGMYNYVDVRRCYWHTSYRLGYIDYKLYSEGMENEEYKNACNAAIGRLAKSTIQKKYRAGALVHTNFSADKYCRHVRFCILQEVWKLMTTVIEKSKRDYAFILTDGLFLGDKAELIARKLFGDLDYQIHNSLSVVRKITEKRVDYDDTYFLYGENQVY